MTHRWLTNWFLYSNHNLFWKSYMPMWCLLFFSLGRAIREKSILLLTWPHNWMLKLAVGQAQWEAALEILETGSRAQWEVALEILETGNRAQLEVALEILQTDMRKVWEFTDLLRTRPNGVRWTRVGDLHSPHNPCTWHSGGSLTGLLMSLPNIERSQSLCSRNPHNPCACHKGGLQVSVMSVPNIERSQSLDSQSPLRIHELAISLGQSLVPKLH